VRLEEAERARNLRAEDEPIRVDALAPRADEEALRRDEEGALGREAREVERRGDAKAAARGAAARASRRVGC
jgi:hypothetical protein